MYLANKRPHAYHQKKLIRQLVEDGYQLEKAPKINRTEPYALFNGPRPDDWFFEIDLKRFHAGEAFYRVESFSVIVDHIGLRAFHHYWPESKVTDTYSLTEARERFYDYLLCGYEFKYGSKRRPQYGICQLIDYKNLASNTLRVFEAWPGSQPNGFAWDLIITINSMPLVAVVFGDKGKLLATAEKALEEVCADKYFATFLQMLIVTDGHTSYMGSPDDDAKAFTRWDNLHDDILSPTRLIKQIYYGIRPGNTDDGFVTFVADYQQRELVNKINLFLQQNMVEQPSDSSQCLGYVLATSSENNLRHPSPFGWMGAVRQMVLEQNILLCPSEVIADLTENEEIDDDTRFAFLRETMTVDECRQLMQERPNVRFVRFVDRPTGPYLVDPQLFGQLICKFDHPIDTLEYEAE